MKLFIVMGVSGCGKTTVARALAEAADGDYLDADDYHPAANKQKMAAGIPLTDEDRAGWLQVLNKELHKHAAGSRPLFLACSALKEIYRQRLREGLPDLKFIYLKGSRELILSRLQARKDHFMPPALLDSQFALLEEPIDAIVVDVGLPVAAIVQQVLAAQPGLEK